MTSKAAVWAENVRVWTELQDWRHGDMTVDRYQRTVKGLNTVGLISSHFSPEHRQQQAESRQLKVVDIKADTVALQNEVIQWKSGLNTVSHRIRSRSPRRDEIKADSIASRRAEALGYVAAHTFIRSEAETRLKAIIDERDVTIAKQAKLIADFEAGNGLIGPVLKSNSTYRIDDEEYWRGRLERPDMMMSVREFINEVRQKSYKVWDMLH